jgi:hypothetical protein
MLSVYLFMGLNSVIQIYLQSHLNVKSYFESLQTYAYVMNE